MTMTFVTPRRIAGSTAAFTELRAHNRYDDADWYPESHPAMPEAVAQERLEEALKQAHVTADALVTVGSAGTAIIEVASEEKAQLIVVGTVGRTGLRRALLGSVAEAVAKGAPCSVLVVRTDRD